MAVATKKTHGFDQFSKMHGSAFNGKWDLVENRDYCRIQWYPGCERFYIIINDNPSFQFNLTEKQLKQLFRDQRAVRLDGDAQ